MFDQSRAKVKPQVSAIFYLLFDQQEVQGGTRHYAAGGENSGRGRGTGVGVQSLGAGAGGVVNAEKRPAFPVFGRTGRCLLLRVRRW